MKLRKPIVAQTVLPLEQNPEQRHEIDPLPKEGKVEANSISASDEQLIKKALDMVEKNLSNPEYSIEDLLLFTGRLHLSPEVRLLIL